MGQHQLERRERERKEGRREIEAGSKRKKEKERRWGEIGHDGGESGPCPWDTVGGRGWLGVEVIFYAQILEPVKRVFDSLGLVWSRGSGNLKIGKN